MRNVLLVVAVAVIALLLVGYTRNWFEFSGKKDAEHPEAGVKLNLEKFKADKEALKKKIGEKTKALGESLAKLKEKVKSLAGDAKTKAEKEIEVLSKKSETIQDHLKKVEESAAEKFHEIEKSVQKALEDEGDKEKGKDDSKPE